MSKSSCAALGLAAGMFASGLMLAIQAASALPQAVTAQSRYGNGSATGAVRMNPRGFPEVQLPSGAWIDCAGDCREAMRRMHLDFWETFQEEGGGERR